MLEFYVVGDHPSKGIKRRSKGENVRRNRHITLCAAAWKTLQGSSQKLEESVL